MSLPGTLQNFAVQMSKIDNGLQQTSILQYFQDLVISQVLNLQNLVAVQYERKIKEIESIRRDTQILCEKVQEFRKREGVLINLLCLEKNKTAYLSKELNMMKSSFENDYYVASIMEEVESVVTSGKSCSCGSQSILLLKANDMKPNIIDNPFEVPDGDSGDVRSPLSQFHNSTTKVEELLDQANKLNSLRSFTSTENSMKLESPKTISSSDDEVNDLDQELVEPSNV